MNCFDLLIFMGFLFCFCADEQVMEKLMSMGPSAVDAELHLLEPERDESEDCALLVSMLDCLLQQLESRQNYELVQAYLARLLKVRCLPCHSPFGEGMPSHVFAKMASREAPGAYLPFRIHVCFSVLLELLFSLVAVVAQISACCCWWWWWWCCCSFLWDCLQAYFECHSLHLGAVAKVRRSLRNEERSFGREGVLTVFAKQASKKKKKKNELHGLFSSKRLSNVHVFHAAKVTAFVIRFCN